MDAALAVFELVERILSFVDEHTLLLSAIRVSRTWYAVITGSRKLQQILWMEPFLDELGADRYSARVLNPFLEKAFPVFLEGGNYRRRHITFRESSFNKRLHRKLMHPNASWRRMLIQRPPVFGLCIFHDDMVMGNDNQWQDVQRKFKLEIFPGREPGNLAERGPKGCEPTYSRPYDLDPKLAGLRMADLYDRCVWELSADDAFETWFQFHLNGRDVLHPDKQNGLSSRVREHAQSMTDVDAALVFTRTSACHPTGTMGGTFEQRFTFDQTRRQEIEDIWEASKEDLEAILSNQEIEGEAEMLLSLESSETGHG